MSKESLHQRLTENWYRGDESPNAYQDNMKQYDELLIQAKNPSTPAETLTKIYQAAQGIPLNSLSRKVERAIAQNGNISVELVFRLIGAYPEAIADNAGVTLLSLENPNLMKEILKRLRLAPGLKDRFVRKLQAQGVQIESIQALQEAWDGNMQRWVDAVLQALKEVTGYETWQVDNFSRVITGTEGVAPPVDLMRMVATYAIGGNLLNGNLYIEVNYPLTGDLPESASSATPFYDVWIRVMSGQAEAYRKVVRVQTREQAEVALEDLLEPSTLMRNSARVIRTALDYRHGGDAAQRQAYSSHMKTLDKFNPKTKGGEPHSWSGGRKVRNKTEAANQPAGQTALSEGLGIDTNSWGRDLTQALKEITGMPTWEFLSGFKVDGETMNAREEDAYQVPAEIDINRYEVLGANIRNPSIPGTYDRRKTQEINVQVIILRPDLQTTNGKYATPQQVGVAVMWLDQYRGPVPTALFVKWVPVNSVRERDAAVSDLSHAAKLLKPLAKQIRDLIEPIRRFDAVGYNTDPNLNLNGYKTTDELAYNTWKRSVDAFNAKNAAGNPVSWSASPGYTKKVVGDLPESRTSLTEAPIDGFNTLGDWSHNSGFKEIDRRIITSPKAVDKIRAMWNKTPFVFDLYFANMPRLNKDEFTEIGEVDMKFVRWTMKLDMVDIPAINPNAITVIFTNNKGSERVMMSGWVMAHRIGHAFQTQRGSARSGTSSVVSKAFLDFQNTLYNVFNEILTNVYNKGGVIDTNPFRRSYYPGYGPSESVMKSSEAALKLAAHQLGTMKSARDLNLRNWNEFAHELFAQYLITGSIKFNPLPDTLQTGHGTYGRKEMRRADGLERDNYSMKTQADILENALKRVLNLAVGKIFVM